MASYKDLPFLNNPEEQRGRGRTVNDGPDHPQSQRCLCKRQTPSEAFATPTASTRPLTAPLAQQQAGLLPQAAWPTALSSWPMTRKLIAHAPFACTGLMSPWEIAGASESEHLSLSIHTQAPGRRAVATNAGQADPRACSLEESWECLVQNKLAAHSGQGQLAQGTTTTPAPATSFCPSQPPCPDSQGPRDRLP